MKRVIAAMAERADSLSLSAWCVEYESGVSDNEDLAFRMISESFLIAFASHATFCISSLSVTKCPVISFG